MTEGIEVLSRTPATLETMLAGLGPQWLDADEGPGTWSPYQVLGHLIHGERTDWIPRLRMILEHGEKRVFAPFDRNAQLGCADKAPIAMLLDEFASLRRTNLTTLAELNLGPGQLALTGRHPAFGVVTAAQLLATWVVHDLGHIAQIGRAMAARYKPAVGPWREYLPVLAERTKT